MLASDSSAWWLLGLAVVLATTVLVVALRYPRARLNGWMDQGVQCARRLLIPWRKGTRMPAAKPGNPVASLPGTSLVKLMLVKGRDILGVIECPVNQFRAQTVGRSATLCDHVVNDSTVSRCHIRLVWEPQAACWYVEDLGSRNGTRLNGSSLRAYLPVPLKQGARLTLGRLQLTVVMENSGSPPLSVA
jgi:hypothetical protein